MDLEGRCHCRVYMYWWYPHNTSDEIIYMVWTARFEPSTYRVAGHCTTLEWRVVQQWRFRYVFGKLLFRNSSRAPNNWTDVFHNLHQFFHTIKIVAQWAMKVSFLILSHLKLKIILQRTLYGLGMLTDWLADWLNDCLPACLTSSMVQLYLKIYHFLDGQAIPSSLWNQTAIHRTRYNPPRVLPCPGPDKSSPHYRPP
jgi:hypothetical protein